MDLFKTLSRLPLLLLLVARLGFASSFYEQPFPEAVRDASAIVRGKVGKSEVQWVTLPDGGKRLFTFYDIEVTEGFKGKPKGGVIRMRELGGEKDGVALQISGAAQFTPGEDVVVMLGNSTEGAENVYPLMGMSMGKYTLEKGPDGKEYLRGSGLGSSIHPSLRKEDNPDMKQREVSLEGLREIVRKQASEPPKPKPEPTVSPSKPANPFLHSQKSENAQVTEEKQPAESPLTPKRSNLPVFPLYVVIGVAGGIYWFLKSKKNRR